MPEEEEPVMRRTVSTRLQGLSGYFLLYKNVPAGAIMEMSKVMHMKSILIIANHMLAHVRRYLILLIARVLSDISSVLIERVRSKLAAAEVPWREGRDASVKLGGWRERGRREWPFFLKAAFVSWTQLMAFGLFSYRAKGLSRQEASCSYSLPR